MYLQYVAISIFAGLSCYYSHAPLKLLYGTQPQGWDIWGKCPSSKHYTRDHKIKINLISWRNTYRMAGKFDGNKI